MNRALFVELCELLFDKQQDLKCGGRVVNELGNEQSGERFKVICKLNKTADGMK